MCMTALVASYPPSWQVPSESPWFCSMCKTDFQPLCLKTSQRFHPEVINKPFAEIYHQAIDNNYLNQLFPHLLRALFFYP